jgi:anti-sigma factor RsiW
MTRTICEELADSIVDYVDGELPADEAEVVARHLSECPRCRQIANDLEKSLGLARIIWQDNLADATAIRNDAVGAGPRACPSSQGNHGGLPLRRPYGHTTKLPRRTSFYVLAVAASILLATGSSLLLFFHQAPQPPVLTFEEVQRQVVRAGTAAELLAATRIVAQCEGTQSIVQQQYRYILREYADTPAAASIRGNHDLKLGGTQND